MPIYSGSRYARCNRRVVGSHTYLTTPARVNFTESLFKVHQVIEGETIDGLAQAYYGNSAYWWCIMDANRQYESEVEIKPGDILNIPDYNEVMKVV